MRVVLYLLAHGPFREPRFIDLQYRRLLRYLVFLRETSKEHVDLVGTYVDIGMLNSYGWLEDLPSLKRLLSDLPSLEADVVLVDFETGRPFKPDELSPILNTLRARNVKVINAFYDDSDALKEAARRRWGDKVAQIAYSYDVDDFITFFPAWAAAIAREVVDKHVRRDRKTEVLSLEDVDRSLSVLANRNPYQGGLPLFSDQLSEEARKLKEEERVERREREMLWVTAPEKEGLLVDEGVFGETRAPESLRAAEMKLEELGFSRSESERRISYVLVRDGFVVYADPRRDGRLDFHVYREEGVNVRGKRRRQNRRGRSTTSFYLLDSWKKNLEKKWLKRFEKAKEELEGQN